MPGILGSDLANELILLKSNKTFKVILVSADYVHGVDHLVDSTLLKPLDLNKVKEI